MISKSLIISTNLQKDITRFDDCLVINMLLTELVMSEMRSHCDMYELDYSLITVQYHPIGTQLDLTDQYRSPLDAEYLQAIVQPTKEYLRHTMLTKWPVDLETGDLISPTKTRLNFNVMFLANGTIFITEEEFES